jgi:hypothetical protein
MRYERRRDAELVELAQDGSAPAFAVLVHRHAPAVLAATADAEDPQRATRDVFVRAMRELPDRDPKQPVGPWLTELAGRPAPWTTAEEEVAPARVDELWRELDRRWPDGRAPRRSRRVLRRVTVAVAAVAIGVAVPAAVLTADPTEDEDVTELRAQPLDDPADVPEPDGEEPRTLPAFEFPEVEDAPLAPLPEDEVPASELSPETRLIPGPATRPGEPVGDP